MVHFGVNKEDQKKKIENFNFWSVADQKIENSDFTLKFGSKPPFHTTTLITFLLQQLGTKDSPF